MSVSVRAATSADGALYRTLWPELGLDEPLISPEQAAEVIPRMLVVEQRGQGLGVVVSDVEGSVGFVRQIMVTAAVRRSGLGAVLLTSAMERLRDKGAVEVRLNVKLENSSAIRLYERSGMVPDFRSVALWVHPHVRFALPEDDLLSVYEPQADDAALEAEFQIATGQLAWFRARGDTIRAVRSADMPHAGIMRFSPTYPGAFPFCASTPAVARALLEETERVMGESRRIGVVIERDERLAESLLNAGAVLRFRMVQMVGELRVRGDLDEARTVETK